MISYIVSVYDRMGHLNACISSLVVNGFDDEIIVCCNDAKVKTLEECRSVANHYGARVIHTGIMGCETCYESANEMFKRANLGWLCFPSDDSLYVADFAEIMLDTAEQHHADLVYCDCVYRVGSQVNKWPAYSVLETQPKIGRIDKTCFIVKRSLFKGFPPHPQNYRDGALIEQLVRDGVKHAKAPGILVVHQ